MNLIKGALHNLSKAEALDDPRYAHGIVVGVLAAIMHYDRCSFKDAMHKVTKLLPVDYAIDRMPPQWQEETKVTKRIFCDVENPGLAELAAVTGHKITDIRKEQGIWTLLLDGERMIVELARETMLDGVELMTMPALFLEMLKG